MVDTQSFLSRGLADTEMLTSSKPLSDRILSDFHGVPSNPQSTPAPPKANA